MSVWLRTNLGVVVAVVLGMGGAVGMGVAAREGVVCSGCGEGGRGWELVVLTQLKICKLRCLFIATDWLTHHEPHAPTFAIIDPHAALALGAFARGCASEARWVAKTTGRLATHRCYSCSQVEVGCWSARGLERW